MWNNLPHKHDNSRLENGFIPVLPSFLASFLKLLQQQEKKNAQPLKRNFTWLPQENFFFPPTSTLIRTVPQVLKHTHMYSCVSVLSPRDGCELHRRYFWLRLLASQTFSSYPDSCSAASQGSLLSASGSREVDRDLPEHVCSQISSESTEQEGKYLDKTH